MLGDRLAFFKSLKLGDVTTMSFTSTEVVVLSACTLTTSSLVFWKVLNDSVVSSCEAGAAVAKPGQSLN